MIGIAKHSRRPSSAQLLSLSRSTWQAGLSVCFHRNSRSIPIQARFEWAELGTTPLKRPPQSPAVTYHCAAALATGCLH